MYNAYTCIVKFWKAKQETVDICCHPITLSSVYPGLWGQKKGLLFIIPLFVCVCVCVCVCIDICIYTTSSFSIIY